MIKPKTVEYRIKEVARYVVTAYDENGSRVLTECENMGNAQTIVEALRAKEEPSPASADFEFGGMKVGPHEEPSGGACISIEMPGGQIVQVWATSTHNGHPRVQVWETTENFENCQEPDHDLTTGSDEA